MPILKRISTGVVGIGAAAAISLAMAGPAHADHWLDTGMWSYTQIGCHRDGVLWQPPQGSGQYKIGYRCEERGSWPYYHQLLVHVGP
ncbi:hypothetical protein ACWEPC_37055 [Nonomuraea sp. NPDC004297]